MSAENNKKDNSNKIRLILGAVLIVILIVLIATGKLDLNQLLGLATEQSEAASGETKNTGSSAAETKAASTEKTSAAATEKETAAYVQYYFRNKTLLNQHYDKHGKDMGFASAKEYEKAASDVINNPNALHKTEKEDGDFVYYIRETNEFVVLSTDGYIRTYFLPDSGYAYYQRQ